jgi:hypothetical protein
MSTKESRRLRALKLGALPAPMFIAAEVPILPGRMTPKQIEKVQKVLDAGVLNPVINKEAKEIELRSITVRIENQVMRDPKIVKQLEEKWAEYVNIAEKDKHIRLDHMKLIAPSAFKSKTDNPDEAAFLSKMRQIVSELGLWLRLDLKIMRDSTDRSRWFHDPRFMKGWISLGYNGEEIPTGYSLIGREDIIRTAVFGKAYHDEVTYGKVRSILKATIKRLKNKVELGKIHHVELAKAQLESNPSAVGAAYLLGGMVGFPERSIWNRVDAAIQNAEASLGAQEHEKASEFLFVAAFEIDAPLRKIDEFLNASMKGASRGAQIAEYVGIATAIIDAAFIVKALAFGLIRIIARTAARTAVAEATTAGAGGAAANAAHVKNYSPGAFQHTVPIPNSHVPAAYQPTMNGVRPVGPKDPTVYPGKYALDDTIEKPLNKLAVTADASDAVAINRRTIAEKELDDAFFKDVYDMFQANNGASPQILDELLEAIDRKYGYKMIRDIP